MPESFTPTDQADYLRITKIVECIATKNGLSINLATRIVSDFCDLILIGILSPRYKGTHLPRIGTFTAEKQPDKDTVNIKLNPTRHTLKILNIPNRSESESFEHIVETQPIIFESLVKEEDGRQNNKPDVVHKSFTNYLRSEFMHGASWKHPLTDEEFAHSRIKQTLNNYAKLRPGTYRALWTLWTSGASRAFIAEHFNFSASSLKRLWDNGTDAIMFMLMFPELEPSVPVRLYDNRF